MKGNGHPLCRKRASFCARPAVSRLWRHPTLHMGARVSPTDTPIRGVKKKGQVAHPPAPLQGEAARAYRTNTTAERAGTVKAPVVPL